MQNQSEKAPRSSVQKGAYMLDIPQLASDASIVSGHAQATQIPRVGVEGDWSVQVKRVSGQRGRYQLHLQAQANVPLQCQRCLQPLPHKVEIDRQFLLLQEDEASASVLDEQETLDVLVLPVQGRFNLLSLLEDELILETPFSPMHAQCPEPLLKMPNAVGSGVNRPRGVTSAERSSPFEVLNQLGIAQDSQQRSVPEE